MSQRSATLWNLLDNWELAAVGSGCVLAAFSVAGLGGHEELPVAAVLLFGGAGLLAVCACTVRRRA